jgi:hypothetical protein
MKIHKERLFRACVLECGGKQSATSLLVERAASCRHPTNFPITKIGRWLLPLPAGEGWGEGESSENPVPIHGKRMRKEGGFVATMEFIALLAIMMLLAIANARALYHLHREVHFLEQQQIKRLDVSTANINSHDNSHDSKYSK